VGHAVENDTAGQYEQAFDNYMKALEQFALHCKYDKNPSSKAQIQKKMAEYLSRAEYLKQVINRNSHTDNSGNEGDSSQTAMGQKKKPTVCSLAARGLELEPGACFRG
jgi:vacuolar protein-sorting-associated protein 4